MTSPTQRTLAFLRKIGANAKVLERYNIYAKKRQDVWGADILACRGRFLWAIQTTSATNHSNRVEKSLANLEVRNWLKCGIPFYIYSWGKRGPRGKRKLWTLRITQILLTPGGTIKTVDHGGEIHNTGFGSQIAAA